MITKEAHIKFWLELAEDDWSAVDTLFNGKKYLQSLFFAHLVIENFANRFGLSIMKGMCLLKPIT
jgi:hypothetical protein